MYIKQNPRIENSYIRKSNPKNIYIKNFIIFTKLFNITYLSY